MSTDINCALRLAWTDNRKIKSRDTPFKWSDGVDQKDVKFRFPCTQLECLNGKYRCKRYSDERPDFCATYPDHIFYGVEPWNTQKIEKLLDDARKDCPGLKDVTVQAVVEMLEERSG